MGGCDPGCVDVSVVVGVCVGMRLSVGVVLVGCLYLCRC